MGEDLTRSRQCKVRSSSLHVFGFIGARGRRGGPLGHGVARNFHRRPYNPRICFPVLHGQRCYYALPEKHGLPWEIRHA
jgi:hypothetical protein